MIVFVVGDAVAVVVGVFTVANAVAVRVRMFVPVVGKRVAVVAVAVVVRVGPLAGVERKGILAISDAVVVVVRVDGVAQAVTILVAGHVVGKQSAIGGAIDRIEGGQVCREEQYHLAGVVSRVVVVPPEQHICQTVAVNVSNRGCGTERQAHTITDERSSRRCVQATNVGVAVARPSHHCRTVCHVDQPTAIRTPIDLDKRRHVVPVDVPYEEPSRTTPFERVGLRTNIVELHDAVGCSIGAVGRLQIGTGDH